MNMSIKNGELVIRNPINLKNITSIMSGWHIKKYDITSDTLTLERPDVLKQIMVKQ